MTLCELNDHRRLLEDLYKTKEIRKALLAASYPGAASTTETHRVSGIRDKAGNLGVEIGDIDTQVEILQDLVDQSELKLLPFIQSIEDNQTRMVFRLRFLRGMAWCEVADVLGGRNTEASVKSVCYRYLST